MALQIDYAKSLVRKVKQVTPTMFEVRGHSVKIQTKKGRQLVICDCCNDTKFCIESPMCVHKLAVIIYLTNKNLYKNIDNLINYYKLENQLKKFVEPFMILDDLRNLERKK